jgi:hypothetical protein
MEIRMLNTHLKEQQLGTTGSVMCAKRMLLLLSQGILTISQTGNELG